MNISISNIAWTAEHDEYIYEELKKQGISGLEIAPTRIFPNEPYSKLNEAKRFAKNIKEKYGLNISSIQSIWYGRTEKIWGSLEEREQLIDYTKKAIDFAAEIKCNNLVFGCPRNRIIPKDGDRAIAINFFKELGDYAYTNSTCIGMEANPPIYNTNFINTTSEAIELIKEVGSKGFKLNLDIGTMIFNEEDISILNENVELINHVHISEPGLKLIEKREIHHQIKEILIKHNYRGYISIEMKNMNDTIKVLEIIEYVKGVFFSENQL